MLNTCWNWGNPKAQLGESRCRSQVTIPQPKQSSCGWLMSLVLTVLMAAPSMTLGDNSPTSEYENTGPSVISPEYIDHLPCKRLILCLRKSTAPNLQSPRNGKDRPTFFDVAAVICGNCPDAVSNQMSSGLRDHWTGLLPI